MENYLRVSRPYLFPAALFHSWNLPRQLIKQPYFELYLDSLGFADSASPRPGFGAGVLNKGLETLKVALDPA